MSSLLYSLSRIWPKSHDPEEANYLDQIVPRTNHSETDLDSLCSLNYNLPTPTKSSSRSKKAKGVKKYVISETIITTTAEELGGEEGAEQTSAANRHSGGRTPSASRSRKKRIRARTISTSSSPATPAADEGGRDQQQQGTSFELPLPNRDLSIALHALASLAPFPRKSFTPLSTRRGLRPSIEEGDPAQKAATANETSSQFLPPSLLVDNLDPNNNNSNFSDSVWESLQRDMQMWEDSGYESPLLLLKTGGDETRTPQQHESQQCTQRTATTLIPRNMDSALSRTKTNPLPPPPPPSSQGQTQAEQDYSQNNSSFFDDGKSFHFGTDMFPAYTSTPIKSQQQVHQRPSTAEPSYSHSSSGASGICRSSSYSSGFGGEGSSSSSFGRPTTAAEHRTATSSCNLNNNNNNDEEDGFISKILEESSSEFHGKYSQWITQIFNLQLDKLQRRLQAQFTQKLENMSRSKDEELLTMQQTFRAKLSEYEASTEKFQHWIEHLADENTRVRHAKDALITELRKSAEDQGQTFRVEMEKELNNVQAECEKEKLTLQQKHAEQLKQLNEASMEKLVRLNEQYQGQVVSMNQYIRELKEQNGSLESELVFYRKSSSGISMEQNTNYQKDREQLVGQLIILRDKISELEQENGTLTSSHRAELLKIQSDSQKLVQILTARVRNSQERKEVEGKKQEMEVHKLQQMLLNQESHYQATIDELKEKYGKKIDELTTTVENLQFELLGGSGLTSGATLI